MRSDPPRLPLRDASGRIDPSELLSRAADALGRRPNGRLLCDAGGITRPDVRMVEALARMHLLVRRSGGSMRLIGASPELLDLLAFCGFPPGLALEAQRQPEHGIEAPRVEEEGDPGDPVA